MSTIIEKLTTPKGAIILLVAIMVIIGLFTVDLSGLSGGNILGQSDIAIETQNGNQVSYWVIPLTQQEFTMEELRTTTTSKPISSATNSKGETVTGDITAKFSLDVQSLGYKTPLVKGNTNIKYVQRLYDADTEQGFFDLKEFEPTSELSTSGITYYDSTTRTWTPALVYRASVEINGKNYILNMDNKAESGVTYTVPNTNPPIYFVESGVMTARNTQSAPSLPSLSAVMYGSNNNELMFVNREVKELDKIFNEDKTTFMGSDGQRKLGWNDVMEGETFLSSMASPARTAIYKKVGNEYIYHGFTKANYDNSELKFEFNDDILNGNWYVRIFNIYYKINSISDFQIKDIDYSEYTLDKSIPELKFETPVVILGTWHIPVEYGNVIVTKLTPKPQILSTKIVGELYDTGTATLEIEIKNIGNKGAIITTIKPDINTEYLKFGTGTSTDNFEQGETKIIKFTIEGSDVTNNLEGKFTVQATGSSGEISTKEVTYLLKDSDLVKDSDKVSIIIRAIDSSGKQLGEDYPIIVSQTSEKQYSVWKGDVIKGNIQISGIETNGLIPQNKEISVTTNNQEFTLVYLLPTETSETNWLNIILVIISLLIITLIGYGIYLYIQEKK